MGSSTALFCGAPGVGEGNWKPSGIGTVDTPAATVVVVVVVVSVADVLVTRTKHISTRDKHLVF